MLKTQLEFEIKKLNFEKNILEGDRKLTEERLNRANEDVSRLKVELDAAELRSRRAGGTAGAAVGGAGDPQSAVKVKELTEKNQKLKQELDSVRSVERTAAIKSCAKMMTNERKKTAKLIQVSRNLKKRRDDLEKCTQGLIRDSSSLIEKSNKMRPWIPEEKRPLFDNALSDVQRQLREAKQLAEGKSGDAGDSGEDKHEKIARLEHEIKGHEVASSKAMEEHKKLSATYTRQKGDLERLGLDENRSSVDGLDASTRELLVACRATKADMDKCDAEARDHYTKVLEYSDSVKKLKDGAAEEGEPGDDIGDDAEPPPVPGLTAGRASVARPPSRASHAAAVPQKGEEDCVIA